MIVLSVQGNTARLFLLKTPYTNARAALNGNPEPIAESQKEKTKLILKPVYRVQGVEKKFQTSMKSVLFVKGDSKYNHGKVLLTPYSRL